jgi:FkbM family methyltransferase
VSSLPVARKITVRLRRVPGTYPVLNALRKRSYSAGIVTVSDFDGTLRMELDLSEHMASQIFWFGYYSRDVLFAIERMLRRGDTFVDVGANIGEVSLFAAKRVAEMGSVLAFEPMARTAERLRRNLDLNQLHNVDVIEMGLADRVGERALYVSTGRFDDGSRHDGLGTMFANGARSSPAGTIRVTTLDELVSARQIERIDGIKLDIEGAELPALSGARDVLTRFKPWLVVEIGKETCAAAGYEPRDIFDFLAAFGYAGFLIGRKGKLCPVGGETMGVWQNVLFAPQGAKTGEGQSPS